MILQIWLELGAAGAVAALAALSIRRPGADPWKPGGGLRLFVTALAIAASPTARGGVVATLGLSAAFLVATFPPSETS